MAPSPRRRLLGAAGFVIPAAPAFARRAAGFALRVALFGPEAVFGAFFAFAFEARFGLRSLAPSRECRMIGLRLGFAAFLAGRRLPFFMVGSP